jgi:hypothetical protein
VNVSAAELELLDHLSRVFFRRPDAALRRPWVEPSQCEPDIAEQRRFVLDHFILLPGARRNVTPQARARAEIWDRNWDRTTRNQPGRSNIRRRFDPQKSEEIDTGKDGEILVETVSSAFDIQFVRRLRDANSGNRAEAD